MAIRYGDRSRVGIGVGRWLNDRSGLDLWPSTTQSASVTVQSSSTTHTKGAWTEIFASTNNETGFILYNYVNFTANTDTSGLLDIGIGAAGSESVVFPDLPAGFANDGMQLLLPVFVPAGSRLSARSQSTISSRSGTYRFSLFKPTFPFQVTGVDAININSATSGPSTLFSTGTVELTASTSAAYKALVFTLSSVGTASMSNLAPSSYGLRTGASGSEVEIARCTIARNTSEQQFVGSFGFTLPCLYVGDIPSGTRLSATGAALADIGMIVYGIKG